MSQDASKEDMIFQKAAVTLLNGGKRAEVKFNIFQLTPVYKPVDGDIKIYDIAKTQKECQTLTQEVKIDSVECQGYIPDDELDKCYKPVYTGLDCLWL